MHPPSHGFPPTSRPLFLLHWICNFLACIFQAVRFQQGRGEPTLFPEDPMDRPLFQVCRRFLPLLVFPVLFSLVPSCQKASPPPEPIRIGALAYDLEGDKTTEGKLTERGARMAIDQANASGGLIIGGVRRPVELVYMAYRDTPEEAVSTAQRLINQERVVALIGPQASRNAIPVAEIAERSGIPMISPLSTNPRTTKNHRFVFRMSFIDDFQGRAVAEFCLKNLGLTKGAVLYDITNPYSVGIVKVFMESFKAGGGELVARETFIPGDETREEPLRRIMDSPAQFLFLPNSSRFVRSQVSLARDMGIDIPFIGSDSWDRSSFASLAAFDCTFLAAHWHPHERSESASRFVSRYRELFGQDPTDTPSLTYDAVQMLLQAIRRADSTEPKAIRDSLYAMEAYSGVTGTIDFVENGDPVKSVLFLEIEGGQISYFAEVLPR